MRIALIGAGAMGEAIVKAVLDRGLVTAQETTIADKREERRHQVGREYGVAVARDNREAVQEAEVVVLAVKPADLPPLLSELAGRLRPEQLVLSIIAGTTLGTLTSGLGHEAIVRAMPNTPARVGEGVSVWTATDAVSEDQKARARAILAAMGHQLYAPEEKLLDMATAVSGSGPAYVFLVIEAFTDAAVRVGLPHDVAEKLVMQTVFGSARYAQLSGSHPAELRREVTSPGGTTADGVLELEAGGLRAAFARAVAAAYEKARRLGGTPA